jgi:serine/threonine protein phosphatase PrpC
VLLVATDGLFKYAAIDVIARVVRASPIGVAAEQLVDLVQLPSGKSPDDVAVVLLSRSSATGPS